MEPSGPSCRHAKAGHGWAEAMEQEPEEPAQEPTWILALGSPALIVVKQHFIGNFHVP